MPRLVIDAKNAVAGLFNDGGELVQRIEGIDHAFQVPGAFDVVAAPLVKDGAMGTPDAVSPDEPVVEVPVMSADTENATEYATSI